MVAIFIQGPKNSGKTALAARIADELKIRHISLENTLSNLARVRDPDDFDDFFKYYNIRRKLVSGGDVSIAEAMEICIWYAKCDRTQLCGFVFEVPADADEKILSIVEGVVIVLDINENLLEERALYVDYKTGIIYPVEEMREMVKPMNIEKQDDDEEIEEHVEDVDEGDEEKSEYSLQSLPTLVPSPLFRVPILPQVPDAASRLLRCKLQKIKYNKINLSSKVAPPMVLVIDATLPKSIIWSYVEDFLIIQRLYCANVLARILPAADSVDRLIESSTPDDPDDQQFCLGSFCSYCPVSLYDEKLEEGLTTISAVYKGFIYLFSSEKARRTFINSPETYLRSPPEYRNPKIAILGVPSSGKSHLAEILSNHYKVPIIDALKCVLNVQSKTTLTALKVCDLLCSGNYLTPDVMVQFIQEEIQSVSGDSGWILDGFPFTAEEAIELFKGDFCPHYSLYIVGTKNLADVDAKISQELKRVVASYSPARAKISEIEVPEDPLQTLNVARRVIDPFAPRATKVTEPKFPFGETLDYCPVLLTSNRILQRGTEGYYAQYKDKIYSFINEQNLDLFVKNPAIYLNAKPTPPRFMFLGAQFAGKSSVAQWIQEHYGVLLINFIDALRILRQKDLIEDSLDPEVALEENIIDMVMRHINYEEPYASKGYILEGFPRFKEEISIAFSKGWIVDAVVVFNIEAPVIMRRGIHEYLRENPNVEITNDEISPLGLIKADILANSEKEIELTQGISEAVEPFLVECIEIDASKCKRNILFQVTQALMKYLENRRDLFNRCMSISTQKATELLAQGIKKLSKYGKICPVSLSERKTLSYSVFGTIPIVLGDFLYWLRSERTAKMFCASPSKFLNAELSIFVPQHVFICGGPTTGKSELAEKVAKEIGLPCMHFEECLELLNGDLVFRDIKIKDALYSGQSLSTEQIQVALQLLLKRFPLGCVFEGIYVPPIAVPSIVFYFMDNNLDNQMKMSPFQIEKNVELARLIESSMKPSMTMWKNDYDNLIEFKAKKSRWYVSNQAVKEYKQNYFRLVEFYSNNEPVSAFRIGLNKKNVTICGTKEYCSVSLIEGFNDLASWDHSVYYNGKVYLMCSTEHKDNFMSNPKKYCNAEYPKFLPAIVDPTSASSCFPRKVEFIGYCPVTLTKTDTAVDGKCDYAVTYKEKLYMLANNAALVDFKRAPHIYATHVPKKKLPIRPPATPVQLLSVSDYIGYYAVDTLNEAIEKTCSMRPKLPFKSITDSASLFLSLYLKNMNPQGRPYSKEASNRKLKCYTKRAKLIEFISKEMKREGGKYIQPERRHPQLDEALKSFFSESKE